MSHLSHDGLVELVIENQLYHDEVEVMGSVSHLVHDEVVTVSVSYLVHGGDGEEKLNESSYVHVDEVVRSCIDDDDGRVPSRKS